MKVLLVYHDALQDGGYPRDIRWLASALSACGAQVVVAANPGSRREGLSPPVELVGFRELPRLAAQADVVHVFTLFLYEHALAFPGLQRKARATVLSWMGHLMPLSLRVHRWRKAAFLHLVRAFPQPTALHVFGPAEEAAIRLHFPTVRTFQASLGVFPDQPPASLAKPSTPQLQLLFFGRNDLNHKGLDLLLEGFTQAIRSGADARLTIAGQPWNGSDHFIERFVEREALGRFVTCLGPVDEAMKRRLLCETDYLVFPSRWDGPPRPIREAIALGTPVVVSPETNMSHLVDAHGAGVTVSLERSAIAAAVSRLATSRADRSRHAEGIARLRNQLQWEVVAKDYLDGYESVLSASSR